MMNKPVDLGMLERALVEHPWLEDVIAELKHLREQRDALQTRNTSLYLEK